jgi:2-keto-4-pentenoate hydratase
MTRIAEVAKLIAGDIQNVRAFNLYADAIDDIETAYRVQDAVTDRLLAVGTLGGIGGYKIAFNNPASMQYYGLQEPCIAPVFERQIMTSGVALVSGDYHSLIVEPEICIVLGKDIDATGNLGRAAILACIESVRPSFELLDHRGAFALDPTAAMAIAQSIHNVGAVIGEAVPVETLDRRAGLVTRLLLDGVEAAEKTGGGPQDPIEVVAWMVSTLAKRGQGLKAGMIVLCGAHMPARPVTGATRVEVGMGEMGTSHFILGQPAPK